MKGLISRPGNRWGGVSKAILADEAVNKEQLDSLLTDNQTTSGNNTHSGTETFSHATGVTTNTITERTAAAGVTVDSVLLKDGGVSNSGATMFAGFFPTAAGQSLSDTGAVNVTSYYTAWTTTGAATGTMAAGTQIGQRKKIKMIVDAGDAVLTPTSLSGGTTITFNDVGDYVEMIWNGSNWFVIENFGCTIA